jgi:hypothetical protein
MSVEGDQMWVEGVAMATVAPRSVAAAVMMSLFIFSSFFGGTLSRGPPLFFAPLGKWRAFGAVADAAVTSP